VARASEEGAMAVTVYLRGRDPADVPDADDVKAENWTIPELPHGGAPTTHTAVLACYAGDAVIARFRLDEVTGYRIGTPGKH
jgi:hypothetical protein